MVALVSRDQMDMHMEDTLSGGASDVDPDVKPVGIEFGLQSVALQGYQFQAR
jgi:hypothetical protein